MSKNKKSMKNSKKRVNNYKIESLEPRLMMDGNLDGWNQEILSAQAAINSSDVNSDIYVSASEEWRNSYVETLQHLNGEDYEQGLARHIVDEGSFNQIFVSTGNVIATDFKNALRETVKDWLTSKKIDLNNVVEIESQSLAFKNLFDLSSPIDSSVNLTSLKEFVLTAMADSDDSSLDYQSHQYLFASRSVDVTTQETFRKFVDAVKEKCNLDTKDFSASDVYNHWIYSSSDYTVQLATSKVANDSLLFEISKSAFATLKGKDVAKFRTDITDFSGVSVKLGLRDKDNLRFEGQMHVQIDGNDGNLEREEIDSASVTAYFRQLNTGDVGKNFGFGKEEDASILEYANGSALELKSSGAGTYMAGVDSNGDSVHEGSLTFSVKDAAELGVSNTSVFYVYNGSQWKWVDANGNEAKDVANLENFRMGPVLQKLSKLAYWLHENSTITKENPSPLLLDNFGNLLNQNVSEIAEFSSFLNDVISKSPKTLNDFFSVKSNVNTSNTISVNVSGSLITISFYIEGNDFLNRNVSLVTSKLEELGFNVVDNQSLDLGITNRKLKFDLEVPLDGSLDLKEGDSLKSALSETELSNLGQVLGSAYVQAEGGVLRQGNTDLEKKDYFVVSVESMKSMLTDPKNPISNVAIKGSIAGSSYAESIAININDDADDLIKKLNLKIDVSSISEGNKEYLIFKLDKGDTFGCSLGSSELAKKVECNSVELYYERLCELPFDENCVQSAYFNIGTLTFAENDEVFVELAYDGTSQAKSFFKLTKDDIDQKTWRDSIVASIVDAKEILEKNIVVRYVGNNLVLSKNGVNPDEFKKFKLTIKKGKSNVYNTVYDGASTLGYLWVSDVRPIDCSTWGVGDIEFELTGFSSPEKLSFVNSDFEKAKSLDDIVDVINAKIDSNSKLKDQVICGTCDGKITFRVNPAAYSSIKVNGSFLNDLGFQNTTSSSLSDSNKCLEITLKKRADGSVDSRIIDLSTIDISNKVYKIVDTIKSLCGDIDYVDGRLIGSNGYDIVSICNINNCSIGSVLGIVGEAKDGFVFKVSGINKQNAENEIKFKNLKLDADFKVSGTPLIEGTIGPVATKFTGATSSFSHTLTFEMKDGLVSREIAALPELIKQCKEKLGNFAKIDENLSYKELKNLINGTTSISGVTALTDILNLKSVLREVYNTIDECVSALKNLEKYTVGRGNVCADNIVSMFSTYGPLFSTICDSISEFIDDVTKKGNADAVLCLNKLSSSSASLITTISNFVSDFNSLIDLKTPQNGLFEQAISTARNELTNILNNIGASFKITPVGTLSSPVSISDSDVLKLGMTLKDEAAQAKANLTDLKVGTLSPSAVIPEAMKMADAKYDIELSALSQLDLASIFQAISSKFETNDIAKTFLDNNWLSVELPILGRSLSDVCGAFSVLNEIQNFFKSSQSLTLQDMNNALAKIGVTSVPTWTNNLKFDKLNNVDLKSCSGNICIDLSKSLNLLSQKIQLDNLCHYGAFRLGGNLEAYLDVIANFNLRINIAYSYSLDAENKVVLDSNSIQVSLEGVDESAKVKKPLFDCSISLRVPSASAELNVGFENLNSPLLKVCGDGTDLCFSVGCQIDVGSSSEKLISFRSLSVNQFEGKLNVELLGSKLNNLIEFGIAKGSTIDLLKGGVEQLSPTLVMDDSFKTILSKVSNVKFEYEKPKDGLFIDLSVLDIDSFTEFDLFEKLRLVADGLSESFRKMQSGVNKQVLSKTMRNIPFIGDKIVSVADCISVLDSKFIEPFRKYVFNAKGMSAETVAEKLYLMLNKAGLLLKGSEGLSNCSATPETWAGKTFDKYYNGIQYYLDGKNEAGWRIRIGGTYTLNPNADFDIGFPGLGLRADGGLKIELKWTLNIGFGVNLNDGAFLLLSNGSYDSDNDIVNETGDDLTVELNIQPLLSKFVGSLGFLEMEASTNPVFVNRPKSSTSVFKASLGVDLNDAKSDKSDGVKADAISDFTLGKEKISVSSLGSGLSVEANFDATIKTYLELLLTAGEMFPSIKSNFAFEWNADSGVSYLAFEDLKFDAGAFIDKMFGGIVEKVQRVIEPIQPLIDFLQSEIPVLNKLPAGAVHITVLDLIKKFGKGKMNFDFLDDLIQLNKIVNMLNSRKNSKTNSIVLSLPDLALYENEELYSGGDKKGREDANKSSVDFLNGLGANLNAYIDQLVDTFSLAKTGAQSELDRFVNSLATLKDTSFEELSNAFSQGGLSVESRLSVKQAGPISSDPYGWQFPIIQEPIAQVVGLLMGKPADLVTYHMRPLVFNFNWANSYPIVGPLCADIGFNFGVCFDLKFGYDTYGMVKWKNSKFKDTTALLDGFYIADWDSSGKDIAEIVFHSGVVAGASVCGRAGINVALDLDVNLNFNDPNNDGKVRLREMAKMLSKPITMFDVSATVEMEAYAYLDYFIGRKKWVLWSSGAFELFDTASKTNTRETILISDLDSDKVVNVGDYASNRGVGDMNDHADDVEIKISDSNKVEVSWGIKGQKKISDNGKVSSNQTLYLYAGEEGDKITITGNEVKFNIVIFGGAEGDEVDLSDLNMAVGYSVTVYGGAGNDIIRGAQSGVNFLFGDYGDVAYVPSEDKKRAEAYIDDEHVADNIIYGGKSALNFIFGGFGSDLIAAGENRNYIFGDGGCVILDKYGNVDSVGVYDLYDEGGADIIFGDAGTDFVYGGAGADHIDGGAGDDFIYGGKGHDVIYGGAGNDLIHGDDGVDIIFGDTPVSADMLLAKEDDKSILNSATNKTETPVIPWKYVSKELTDGVAATGLLRLVKPASGFESVDDSGLTLEQKERKAFFEKIDQRKSDDSKGADVVYGDNGSDIIFGDNGSDEPGNGATDFLYGGAGNDFIDGDDGNDSIYGESGEDVIYGGLGDDVLDGGADNDIVFGDNGLNGYNSISAASDILFENSERKIFGDALAVILQNFKIDGIAVRSDLSAKNGGGNDTIYAGNDSDFIDGQSGNDSYKISFMGGFYSAYTNIMDSGNDTADSMSVEGTIENDNLLVRASDKKLGMIALLPDTESPKLDASETENANQYKYEKKKIERINYWTNGNNRGVEQVSLNAGAGDDKIAVDGTLSALAIDAGAGDDTITVGQMFKSERTKTDANVAAVDEFSTTLTTQGFLSNGSEHPTTITGGLGNDTFNLLHASAATALVGGEGNDTFNIATFQKADKSSGEMLGVLQNAPVTLIGGVGGDKMNIVGSDGDDTFVVSGGSVQASGVDIQAVSIENQDVFGGAGDDSFYVLDTIENSVTHLYGNEGNDSFYNGGTQSDTPYIEVDNIDYKGHSGIIEHVVESSTDKYMQTKAAAISVNIRDNDSVVGSSTPVEVLFVDASGKIIEPSAVIKEGSAETVYYLKLSRDLKAGESVTVNVYAPSLSEEAVQRGDRGFVFIDDGKECRTLSVTFDSANNGKREVKIKALDDKLVEENDYFTLLHKVESSTVNFKPCRNVMLFFKDETSVEQASGLKNNIPNKFVQTMEYVVTAEDVAAESATIGLYAVCQKNDVTVWYDNVKTLDFKFFDNAIILDWKKLSNKPKVGTRVYISYMHDQMVIDNKCAIQMQYDTSDIPNSAWALEYAYDAESVEISKDELSNALKTLPSDSTKITINDEYFNDSPGGIRFDFWYTQTVTIGTSEIELNQLLNGLPNIQIVIGGEPKLALYDSTKNGYEYYYSVEQKGAKHTIKVFDANKKDVTNSITSVVYFASKALANTDESLRYIDVPADDSINTEASAFVQKTGVTLVPPKERYNEWPTANYYYKTAGNQLIICDAKTGQPISVTGTFYFVQADVGVDSPILTIPDEPDPVATTSKFEKMYKEDAVGRVVITQSSGSTDVSETSGVTDTYAISLAGPALENKETVRVYINSLATTVHLEDGTTAGPEKQVEIAGIRFLDVNNNVVADISAITGTDEKKGQYVEFNASNYNGFFEITVKGIDDNFVESDSPKLIAVGENTIENIKGALFEDGAGRKPDFDLDNPMMVHYGVDLKKNKDKDEQNEPSETYNKVQTKMAEKMESADEYASVGRMFVNNMDNVKDNAVSSLNALDKVDPNVKTRKVEKIDANDTYNKKIGKSDSELYDSDRFSLRFKHSDISASGINFGNMEYAEINLGSGTDKVNINKTVYREDGFQTFTVVNSGSGKNETATGDRKENAPYDDEISINSYAAEKNTSIASLNISKDKQYKSLHGEVAYIVADLKFGKDFDNTIFKTFATENSSKRDEGLLAVHRMFLNVEYTDGSIQRREIDVDASTSAKLILKRDLTPVADGVDIKSVALVSDYNGDGILVVNAQGGDDKITATNSEKITREDLVLIGGTGADTIDVATNAIVFGDRGQVEYRNEEGKVVTRLGSLEISKTDKNAANLNKADYTTPTSKDESNYFQTDGVVRDAFVIKSMSDDVGGNDIIKTHGDKNVAIGGAGEDLIHLEGNNNVALGDNGLVEYESTVVDANNNKIKHVYGDSHKTYLHHIETTSDTMGGKDEITTGNGNNVVMGGTASDKIATGDGNDIIIGDGGEAYVDRNREALLVSNQGRNLDGNSAGSDVIKTSGGDNVIFGGLNSQSRDFDFVKNEESKKWESTSVAENNEDLIVAGSGKDVVFGDNAYASFRGNYKMVEEKLNTELPTFQTGNSSEEKEIKDTSILSFNFTGDSDKRITPEMEAGVESAKNWNNISGHLSGTYGNNDNEIVRFDDGTRASAISVSYGGHENHRNTSTDSRINLQGYNHWFNGNDGNTILMNSGLMSTAPNQQCGSLLEVSVDGLAQYYESYDVIVYLDIPDSHSSYNESVRKITLSTEDGKYKESFYIDDRAEKTFSGSFVQSSNTTASAAIEAVKSDDKKVVQNYVVFKVGKQFAADRIIITVEDGLNPYLYNGKDLPGIAGLQIKGDLHKQDVAVSTDIDYGGNDVVDTNGGDDIVVGGTGNDVIVTYGDERYSIDDNDVVYGDNAKLLFADRDNNPNTATTLTKAESIAATNLAATYDDAIRTGDGNDVVVGGIGSDAIFSGDVKTSDNEDIDKRFDSLNGLDANKNTDKVKLDKLNILSFNFTANNSGDEARVDYGVAAGVVVDDDWHDFYRNDRGVLMCDDTKAGWTQSKYEEEVNEIANNHAFNTFATVDGVNVDLYGRSVQNNNPLGLSAYTQENVAELDGDTANSKIFNSSLALHSQEEIILKLSGLDNYLADKDSGETKGDQKTYDVYVYLGGDNDNSDTYNFVYDVYSDSYGNYAGEHRYVNDWVGHFFDGDYREATCTDADKARVVAKNGVTPRVEMIGNYVVFRGVTGDKFTVHIRNYNIPETNQWPKNLPVITAVQIVTGKGRFELNEDGNPKTNNDGEKVRANVAIGGDHDKDLVYGDDAYLEFDVDIPFGVGEHINDFQNRVVSANSMAIKHDDAVKVDTRDIIYTGKDRDVVVGGEEADTIKTGAADDVVVGDNANLMMEHNNPIGVFTPSNEITLDDHTIDTSTKEDYLGHDNVTVETIQRKYDPNWGNQNNGYMGWGPNGWGWYSYNNNNARGKIDGIKEPADTENTGRKDNIVDDEGSNLLIEGQWGTEKLYDPESLQPVEGPNVNTDDPNNGNEDPNVNTDDPNNGNENPNVNTDDPNNENQDLREVFVGNMYGETKISIGAGETIKLVITNWDKGDQWYTPNIGIKVDASGRHSLVIKWDELGENASQEQSGNPEPISFENVAFVDIPNTSNVENEEKIVLYIHSEEAFQFSVYLINLG